MISSILDLDLVILFILFFAVIAIIGGLVMLFYPKIIRMLLKQKINLNNIRGEKK